MTKTLADEIVDTDYGQFDLVWSEGGGFDGDDEKFFDGQINGLVGASHPTGIYMVLARRSGGSHVQIALEDSPPGDPATSWEDVVEVSTVIPAGSNPGWLSWAGETGGELDLPAGFYRVRVSARGRDAGAADEFADGVVDHYLVELWPAPVTEDAILRVGSDDARYWHRTWGSRR